MKKRETSMVMISATSKEIYASTGSDCTITGKMHVSFALARISSVMTMSTFRMAITTTRRRYKSCNMMKR